MSDVFFAVNDLTLSYIRSRRRPGFIGFFRRLARENVTAVNHVSLSIDRPGRALAIIGESGCGKTSVLKAIVGRVALPNNVGEYSGEVWLEGRNLMEMSESKLRDEIRWKKIAVVPQDAMATLNPVMRIGAQIRETLKVHGVANARIEVPRLLEDVELSEEFADRYPHQLSGGQQQRVVIALALALKPSLVILDEPTSALDASVRGSIIELLDKLRRERNLSYLFITHDIELAKTFCDLFAVFYGGRVVEFGSTASVFENPQHPYTKALLYCVSPEGKKAFASIDGEPPDLARVGNTCPCAQRPAVRCTQCIGSVSPELREIAEGHFVACHDA